MKVVIIGTGNTATVLGKVILRSGHTILQIAGRNHNETNEIASVLHADSATDLRQINLTADLYIIAVSDRAIGEVACQLGLSNQLVVHTAGSVSREVLAKVSVNYGVLYPVQTLRKEMLSLPKIPVAIDANNQSSQDALSYFSSSWADEVLIVNDERRLQLHISAVFANNFTNHLLTLADNYCVANSLNFNILKPLIEETLTRILNTAPVEVQTGPAVRNDSLTISKHREMLTHEAEMLAFYEVFTNSIIRHHASK